MDPGDEHARPRRQASGQGSGEAHAAGQTPEHAASEPSKHAAAQAPEHDSSQGARVDVFDSDGTWLTCGSLITPELAVPHRPLPPHTGLAFTCIIHRDSAEVRTGVTLASADDAPATALAIDPPSGQPLESTPRPPDLSHGERLQRWLDTVARHSGCSHTPPPAAPAPDQHPDGRSPEWRWICATWPKAPGCS